MLPITYANAHRRLLHVQEQQTRVPLEPAIVVPQGLRVASPEKLVSLELASVERRAAVLEFRQGRIAMLLITYANAHQRLLHVQEQRTHVRLEPAIVVPQGLRVASQEKLVSLELASVEPRPAVLEFRQGRIAMLPITYVNVHLQWLHVVEQQTHVLLELAIVVLQVLRAVTAVKPVSLERVCVERAPLALVKQPELSVMQPITYVNVHPQSLPALPAQNAREEPVFLFAARPVP